MRLAVIAVIAVIVYSQVFAVIVDSKGIKTAKKRFLSNKKKYRISIKKR